jgi:argininosuccinate lyase
VNARSGTLLGTLTGFLTSARTIPATFNAESPATRSALFEAADQVAAMLTTVDGAISTLTVHPDRMYDALEERILATDVVDYLTARGDDPEKAQRVVEALFARVASANKLVADMDLKELQKEDSAFDADVFALFDYSRSAAQRATIGGTAPAAIRSQIRRALNWMVEAGLE